MTRSALILTLAAALTACNGADKPADTAPSEAAAANAAVGAERVALSNGRLVLPAVKGNPAAAYFTLDNAGTSAVVLKAIAVDGAKAAEIHQTQGGSMAKVDLLEAQGGTTIKLEPGGLHAMVFGPSDAWRPGMTATLVGTLADGKTLTAPLKIEAPGGMGDMEGMGH
jgi:copper(I)-binding protein